MADRFAFPPAPVEPGAPPAPDNGVRALVDDAVADGHGARVALVGPRGAVSYAELQRRVDGAAVRLRAAGVEPGERVALLLRDGVDFAAAFLGAIKLGAVAVPLSTRLAGADLAALLGDCGPRALVAEADLLAGAGAGSAAGTVLTARDLESGEGAGVAAAPVGPDAPAFWLYTSGTTGQPKAAMHRHRTLLAGGGYGRGVLGLEASDRVFATSKLFFAYALGNALLNPLAARASAYLLPEWPDPESVRGVLESFRPTLLFSVPTLYARLLRADLPRSALASVRACVSAGERLPADLYTGWCERFGVEILDGIGATETIFMVLSSRPGESRPGSTGRPVPGTAACLLDGEDRPVPDGEQGVLWVRAPSVAAGYWQREGPLRRAFVGEWFRTGDLYTRSADDHFVHGGRQDDLFKVAGQWVVPADIEAVAASHPDVLDAGVVGAEDAEGLLKPHLFVVAAAAAGPALRAELAALLEARLPRHARPREIAVVGELPRTATGKLQRFRLAEAARARAARPPRASE
jgi:4-hydroxybenzoate-CoA ligase/benzoate-CoA ligase